MPKLIKDKHGNTELHLLIINGCTIEELTTLIESRKSTHIAKMSTTINNYGFTPLQYINNPLYSANERSEIRSILFPFMIWSSTLSPIQQAVAYKRLLRKYESTASDELLMGLIVGTEIITQVRDVLHFSSTHPELNYKDPQVKTEIIAAVDEARKNRTKSPSSDALTQLHHDVTVNILPNKIGNCSEYAKVALYFSIDNQHIHRTEKFEITNGDHAILVINRLQGSDENDVTTWGESAVIVDAWSGNTYPASAAPHKLSDYHCYQVPHGHEYHPRINVLIPYQSNYHQLLSRFSLTLTSPEPERSWWTRTTSSLFSNTLFRGYSTPESDLLERRESAISRMV